MSACASFGSRLRSSRSAAIRSSTRTTRGRSNLTNSVSTSVSGRRFTTTVSPRSSRCSQSMQQRNTCTSLAKRARILVSGSVPSAVSFPSEPAFDDRSSLSQTGICWASGALSSWWMRLELRLVAPAICGSTARLGRRRRCPNPFGLSVAKAEGCGPESGDQLLLELHPLAQVLSAGGHQPVLYPGTRSCPQN